VANALAYNELRQLLAAPPSGPAQAFWLIKSVANHAALDGYGRDSQELVLRLLGHRDAFPQLSPALDALLRAFGLFPYIHEPKSLLLRDAIAHEMHRSELVRDDKPIYLHREQASALHALLRGENVILSAPTSFGKSLIIDAAIAAGNYRNVALVVPTLALVDETRRRMRRFRKSHKIITHGSQSVEQQNIFILTQERVVENAPKVSLDLFVIDEFYKLSPGLEAEADHGRVALLNQAFYRLRRTGAQFYMLGPNVHSIAVDAEQHLKAKLIISTYSTVVTEVVRVPEGLSDDTRLLTLAKELTEPTIVYCRSPKRASSVATLLARASASNPRLRAAADWLAKEFHPDWSFASALRAGVGIHHGHVPRSLAQMVLRKFNDGSLKYLVCTSTLIEGVNTCAKNIILYDNAIGKRQLDLFTFNNIKGRSGRMFQHLIGRVFLFHEPPATELPTVDVPVLTQSDAAPPSLLLQLDANDLTERSRQRLERYEQQIELPIEVLRQNNGVDPDMQIALAREIRTNASHYRATLNWIQRPSYHQLCGVIELLRRFPLGGEEPKLSNKAAATLLEKFRRRVSLHQIIADQIPFADGDADKAVTDILKFMRNFMTFAFPSGLRALDLVQRHVFSAIGEDPGSYGAYCRRAENAFLPGALYSLDEFGIPLPLALKLVPAFPVAATLDESIAILRRIDPDRLRLSPFERDLLAAAQDGL
jgi:hypothetical protein